jgi:phosphoribosylglycinamide formyltransferase-1
LLNAAAAEDYPARVVAVGSDLVNAAALERANAAGVSNFVVPVGGFPTRAEWDLALTAAVAAHDPDLVVLAGFMRLVGPEFVARFDGRAINSHPALLPAFPGAHAVADALAHGVRVTGTSLIFIDAGVDSGPIIAQVAVPVLEGDDEAALHERIKQAERSMLVEQVARLVRNGWTIEDRKVSVP